MSTSNPAPQVSQTAPKAAPAATTATPAPQPVAPAKPVQGQPAARKGAGVQPRK